MAAWVIGLLGLVLAWVAAASYIAPARKALADGRRHDTDDEGMTR